MSNFIEFIDKIASENNDKLAMQIRRQVVMEKTTYSDIKSNVYKLLSFYNKNNIEFGDKILIWGLNCPEYSTLLLSCFTFGRVSVPVDFKTTVETVEKIIDQVQPKIAFVSKYLNADFIYNRVEKVYFIEDILDLIADFDESNEIKDEYKDEDNLIQIVFTSGSTGTPKGVMMSQKNILSNLDMIDNSIPKLKEYKTISILPLSHVYEQIVGMLMILKKGAEVLYLPQINSFRLLEAIGEYNPTHLLFVPQLYSVFLDKIFLKAKTEGTYSKLEKGLKFAPYLPRFVRKLIFKKIHKRFGSNFKFFGSAGAPLNYRVANIWENFGFKILEGYGATEIVAAATFNNFEDKRLGSVGKPLKGVEIKFEDKEILVKSPSVTLGYYKNKEKTDEVFKDGWYKTGDIGHLDKDGYLYIEGRDAFKIVLGNGENIYVEDIEQKINKSNLIFDSFVYDYKENDEVRIGSFIIQTDRTKTLNLEKLLNEINSELESKQQISKIETWPGEDFPRTHTLRINRRAILKALDTGDSVSKLESGYGGASKVSSLLDVISAAAKMDPKNINKNDTLFKTLRLDSLKRIELLASIEEYMGVRIEEAKVLPETTVHELEKMVKDGDKQKELVLANWQFKFFGRVFGWFFNRLLLFPLHRYAGIKIDNKNSNINNIKLSGGRIILINHPGLLDLVAIMRYLNRRGVKKIATLIYPPNLYPKKFRARLFEGSLGALPLFRDGTGTNKVLQICSDLLDNGYYLVIAPQGKMKTVGGNSEHPFMPGAAYMLKLLGKPVNIVTVNGYHELWPVPVDKHWEEARIRELGPMKKGSVTIQISEELTEHMDEKVDLEKINKNYQEIMYNQEKI
ncbi:MAG: AMP-binding protein [Candidatus Dojkabacteria bacterium]|nr:AMP-binding protein [Candidatus Dojkabacteria bacterium]MDQ7021194.1 AMP-binding protein [Candidatus Dojkabacteria bacterium]